MKFLPHLLPHLLFGLLGLGLAARAAAGSPMAQEPPGDLVVVGGEELHGRVVARHGAVLELRVDGRLERFDAADVQRVVTRADRASAWLDKRRPGQDPVRRMRLVEAAQAAGLEHLARLAALELIEDEPDCAPAREFLGHRGGPGAWRRRHAGRFVDEQRFAEETERKLELESEHFVVATDAGLARALQIAFDLEALHARWNAEFAGLFLSQETLHKLRVRVFADPEDAPVHSSALPLPYFDPARLLGSQANIDPVVVTWFEPGAARPRELFSLSFQALLYLNVLGERLSGLPRDTARYREHAALELALGAYVERTFEGPAGHGRPCAFVPDPIALSLARRRAMSDPIAGRTRELPYLALLSFERLQLDARENALYRAKLELLAAFLMDPATRVGDPQQSGREALGALVRASYLEPRGVSTAAWERALGEDLGRTESAYRAFLDATRSD